MSPMYMYLCLQSGPRDKFRQLLHYMDDVLAWRRNLVHSSATQVSPAGPVGVC